MTFTIAQRTYAYWIGSFVGILIIISSVYYLLGGFRDVQLVSTKPNRYVIIGKLVSGIGVMHEEEEAFEQMQELVSSKKVTGDLCVINYKHDSLVKYEVSRFIGVLMDGDNAIIPSGFSMRKIDFEVSYIAVLTMHPLVMPNSTIVETKLTQFAKSSGNKVLRNYTLERHYPDNSVIVEMFPE